MMEMERGKALKRLSVLGEWALEKACKEREGKTIRGEVLELTLRDGITGRMLAYYPETRETTPVYLDIHGGGFTWGSMYDAPELLGRMADELGIRVFSLEYPLIPEAVYPKALDHLAQMIESLKENAERLSIDPDRIVIGGRSAGGNLAAALCIKCVREGLLKPFAQILDHPMLDLAGLYDEVERYTGREALSGKLMMAMRCAYAQPWERQEMYCTPFKASKEVLSSLPAAVIQVCEKDGLAVEGELYGALLRENGVRVIERCMKGAVHSVTEGSGAAAEEAQTWLIESLRTLFTQK